MFPILKSNVRQNSSVSCFQEKGCDVTTNNLHLSPA